MLRVMADLAELKPLFLLNDEAIAAFEEDGLGMNEHAQVIAEAVLGTQSPFTVGIFGPWGHGKTSLLNAARTMLEQPKPAAANGVSRGLAHPHVITVHFNAWRYEREQHPIVPLLATIAQAVDARLKAPAPAGTGFTEPAKSVLRTIVKGCNTAGRVIGALTRRLTLSAEVPGTGVKVETNVGEAVDAAKKAAAAPSNPAGDIADSWIEHSLYFSAFDDLAALHKAARADAANATRQAPVVAVFIDDLDRCRPENAVAVLEGIKLVLSQPGFVFVLALYREVIERYLEKESEKRFDSAHARLGHGYIDKIVQLPLTLRSHAAEFETFIEFLIKKRLEPGLLPVTRDPGNPEHVARVKLVEAIRGVKGLLAYTSEHSPRKLVRRVNELLLDDRLCPKDAAATLGCKPEEVRVKFLPLCLIQRSLMELPAPGRMMPMVEDQELCTALAKYKPELAGMKDADGQSAAALFVEALRRLVESSNYPDPALSTVPVTDPLVQAGMAIQQDKLRATAQRAAQAALRGVDATKAGRWLKKLDFVTLQPRAGELLSTAAGRDWLRTEHGRRLVRDFIATRPPAEASAEESDSVDGPLAFFLPAVRQSLELSVDAPVGPEEFGRVEELVIRETGRLPNDVISLFTSPGWPFPRLRRLVCHTMDDRSLIGLARADSRLSELRELIMAGGQFTDAGLVALGAEQSALVNLVTLDVSETQISDTGACALVVSNTGLKSLDSLNLRHTRLTDSGVARMSDPKRSRRGLVALDLSDNHISDSALEAMAANGSTLLTVRALSVSNTNVSNRGLGRLGTLGSGLSYLQELDVSWNGSVTEDGLRQLLSKDCLPFLTTVYAHRTGASPDQIVELNKSRPDLRFVTTPRNGVARPGQRWPRVSW